MSLYPLDTLDQLLTYQCLFSSKSSLWPQRARSLMLVILNSKRNCKVMSLVVKVKVQKFILRGGHLEGQIPKQRECVLCIFTKVFYVLFY